MIEHITFKLAFEDTRADLCTGVHERLDIVEQWLADSPAQAAEIVSVFICGVELLQEIHKLDIGDKSDFRTIARNYHIFVRAYEQLAEAVLVVKK